MTGTRANRIALISGVLVLLLAATVGRTAAFHFLPLRWTGEAERLAEVLQLRPGATVADIGAGDGEMAVEIVRAVGDTGLVYATEIDEEQRADISDAARDAGLSRLRVVAAAERATGLPDGCCDAIYLRNVLHHIADQATYAKDLHRTLKPGGRLAVIDFEPGGFFHLAGSHGISPAQVVSAMTAAGLRLERPATDWGGGLFMVLFRKS